MKSASAGDRDASVFINCPFDRRYKPMLDAIALTVVCCGFKPRCALDRDASVPRIQRIHRHIKSSKYSLHDLSRCTGEGKANLARLNVALELGIAMGHAGLKMKEAAHHFWQALVPHEKADCAFISDIRGFDPLYYKQGASGLVGRVMAWLGFMDENMLVRGLTPALIVDALPELRRRIDATIKGSHWDENDDWLARSREIRTMAQELLTSLK